MFAGSFLHRKIFLKKIRNNFKKGLYFFLKLVYTYNVIKQGTPTDQHKQEEQTMFKKFIQRIIDAKDREDAYSNVFYGDDGIDVAYQRGKITWNEHEMLVALIDKLP